MKHFGKTPMREARNEAINNGGNRQKEDKGSEKSGIAHCRKCRIVRKVLKKDLRLQRALGNIHVPNILKRKVKRVRSGTRHGVAGKSHDPCRECNQPRSPWRWTTRARLFK